MAVMTAGDERLYEIQAYKKDLVISDLFGIETIPRFQYFNEDTSPINRTYSVFLTARILDSKIKGRIQVFYYNTELVPYQ